MYLVLTLMNSQEKLLKILIKDGINMSFKEINAFALFFILTMALIVIYISGIAFIIALITFSNWFGLLLALWILLGAYALIISIWLLLERSTNI